MPVPATRGLHQRSLLRDDVYRTLRDAIVRGDLQPGEKLRDADLSEWLGVSRTPIREALLRLERAGLVVATPGRLTMVAPEDDDAVTHAQQVAAELHALAIRLAAPRLDETAIAEMDQANRALRDALTLSAAQEAIDADDAFHHVAVQACGNPLIAEHLEAVTATLRRREFLHFGSLTGADSPAQHDAIITALRTHDPEAAAELTRQNWLRLSRKD